jgi:hypothetical protein
MPTSHSSGAPRWALLVIAGSFLFAVLVGWMDSRVESPADLLTQGHVLAMLLYTLIFSVPILLILAVVQWLERRT